MTSITRGNTNHGRRGQRGGLAIGVLLVVVLIVAIALALDWTAKIWATRSSQLNPITSGHDLPANGPPVFSTVLRVVLLSDTHGRHRELTDIPGGDVLIFAGDFTAYGDRRHAVDFNDWLGGLPHAHKVVVAGNHDGEMHLRGNPTPKEDRVSLAELPALLTNVRYLQDSGFAFRAGGDGAMGETVRVWGSPWQPQYPAFETYRPPGRGGGGIGERWDLVPDDTTILVAHTPPRGTLDGRRGQGCVDLASRIAALKSASAALRLVAFGHLHESHGTLVEAPEDGGVTYVNAAIVDGRREVAHKATVISLNLGGDTL